MLEKRDNESRSRIQKNIDRHVKAVSRKKTNDEVHKIAIEYFSKKYKGRVLWVLNMK